MSMSYGVYIGPFIRCEIKDSDFWVNDATDDRLTGLRGELSSDDGDISYIGPNQGLEGIEREFTFSRHDETPVVMRIDQQAEIDAFKTQYAADIAKLDDACKSLTIEWGVVPEFS